MKIWMSLLLIFFWTIPPTALARKTIKVGLYPFAPFVSVSKDGRHSGITLDFIEEFNRIQSEYNFEYESTSSKRRYWSFTEGHFDVMLFESINWGWVDYPVVASKEYLSGEEVYITQKDTVKDQLYFDSFADKTLVGIRGYHCGFANFNADETHLRGKFKIHLTSSNEKSIILILLDRADIAVVTKSYLQQYILQNPGIANKLLISEKMDQVYQHTVLLRKGIRPTVSEINAYLTKMENQGVMQALWKKYDIR